VFSGFGRRGRLTVEVRVVTFAPHTVKNPFAKGAAMRKTILGSAIILLATAGVVDAAAFTLTSTSFKPNAQIPEKMVANTFGCAGENVSPALEWKNPPAGTKSFALMVHDPDAPTGGAGFWHWIVFNIPPDATGLPEGAGSAAGTGLPKGAVQWNTDFGTVGWGGPCPPPGPKHKYNFTLYALKVDKIDVPAGASPAVVGFNVTSNALGKAKLGAVYARKAEPPAKAAAPAAGPPAGVKDSPTGAPPAPPAPPPPPKPAAPAPK
jgi:Raf kinase inhibitor-like YbhB/YbcL family protein